MESSKWDKQLKDGAKDLMGRGLIRLERDWSVSDKWSRAERVAWCGSSRLDWIHQRLSAPSAAPDASLDASPGGSPLSDRPIHLWMDRLWKLVEWAHKWGTKGSPKDHQRITRGSSDDHRWITNCGAQWMVHEPLNGFRIQIDHLWITQWIFHPKVCPSPTG